MIIHEFEQQSEEWYQIRLGKVTASMFKLVMGNSSTKKTYGYKLVSEKITRIRDESYFGKYMKQGVELEPEARDHYEKLTGNTVREVGFIEYNEYIGLSPDGLIGDDGGIEIKCPIASTHVKYLDEERLPVEYLEQVQGSLLYTGRKWWDFLSFCPDFPTEPEFRIRIYPDAKCHVKMKLKIDKFAEEVKMKYNKRINNSPY